LIGKNWSTSQKGRVPGNSSAQERPDEVLDSSILASRVSTLERSVIALEKQIVALQEQVSHPSVPQPSALEVNSRVVAPAIDPSAAAEQMAARHAQLASFETDFRKEMHDPRWSSSATQTLREAVDSDEVLKDQVDALECRSKNCRLEVRGDGAGSVRQRLGPFLLNLGDKMGRSTVDYVDDGSGHKRIVLYIGRREGG